MEKYLSSSHKMRDHLFTLNAVDNKLVIVLNITWFTTLPIETLVRGLFAIDVGSTLQSYAAVPVLTLEKDSS